LSGKVGPQSVPTWVLKDNSKNIKLLSIDKQNLEGLKGGMDQKLANKENM